MSMVALVEGSTLGIVVGAVVARVVSVVAAVGVVVGTVVFLLGSWLIAAAAGKQRRGKDENQYKNGIFFHVFTSK